MRGTTWRDLGELIRSARLAGPLPNLRRLTEFVTAFEQAVAPIAKRAGQRRCLDDALCDACVKLCMLLTAYAATAGVPFRADLAVLGGAVARVYDDLVDAIGTDDADGRIAALFGGAPVRPGTRQEWLLHELYRELERRLNRDRTDPVYAALRCLHAYQVRSRLQHDLAIGSTVLAEITAAKGGYAMVVFAGLMHPAMTDRQINVVWELGGALQLLDDYLDTVADRRAGITTAATRGQSSLADVCRRLRAIRPALRACFGRDQPLSGLLYLHLWLAFLKCRTPGWPARYRPFRLVIRVLRRRVRRTV
jgi:hypothetical protein